MVTKVSGLRPTQGLLYGVALVGILVALSLLGTFDTTRVQGFYALTQVLALGVGVLYIWLGNRLGYLMNGQSFSHGLLLTFALLLIAIVGALVAYQWTGYLETRWPFVSSLLPFVVPFLVAQAYAYYLLVPPADYKKWYYPINGAMPDVDLLDLSKVLVIQFEFRKSPADVTLTNFKAKAPVAMPLGELFLIFINDYNERTPAGPIGYLNEENQPYGWVFYAKTSWWQRRRYLDPDATFVQNGLVDNATILAERVA